MRKLRLALITICFLACPSLYGQTTAKKKAPTVQGLQQQVIELQGKLMECQNTAKANEPNPMKDALEAFQTFNSTIATGVNYTAYRDALIPLKVRIDKLPDNEQTAPMKTTLEMFVDAGSLWNRQITTSGGNTDEVYAKSYSLKYPDVWSKTDSEWTKAGSAEGCIHRIGNGTYVTTYCLKLFSGNLIGKGQENIKGFTTVSKP